MTRDGLHHVGMTVRNLKASLAWYRDKLEIEPEFESGGSGPELSTAVGCDHASLSFAFIKLGDTNLELLEYQSPNGEDYALRNCDVGAAHIAFRVDNIDESYQRLTERGVEFSAPPIKIGEGPLAGCGFAYFRDPDGIQLELFQPS